MKQFLTPEDLTKAPQEVRTKLVEFCKKNNIYTWKRTAEQLEKMEPDEYNLPLFSIGQLIEYLHRLMFLEISHKGKDIYWYVKDLITEREYGSISRELIDALWEAICGKEGKTNGK